MKTEKPKQSEAMDKIFISSNPSLETFLAPRQLRWLIAADESKTLQQASLGNRGSVRWEDVPTVHYSEIPE